MAVEQFEKSVEETFQRLVKKVLDENAIHYQYEATKTDLVKFQSEINAGVEELLQAQAQLHFNVVEATTVQEWDKTIQKN
jgi:ferritin-like protein